MEVYVKCDHVIPSDIKMGRLKNNEIEVWPEIPDFGPVMFIHICNSCKAAMGKDFSATAQL